MDIHVVDGKPTVLPMQAFTERSSRGKPWPKNVTLVPAETGMLGGEMAQIAHMLKLSVAVALLVTKLEEESTVPGVSASPEIDLANIELDDLQNVAVEQLAATRQECVAMDIPIPVPRRTSVIEPVAGEFVAGEPHRCGRSKVIALLSVFARDTVNLVEIRSRNPEEDFAEALLEETQRVEDEAHLPNRRLGEKSDSAATLIVDRRVTEAEPVASKFVLVATKVGVLKDTQKEMETGLPWVKKNVCAEF